MSRRPAVTLIEVLVAIFIMAIGLLALLTLFPLGMLRMAQAIRDDRAATCARNAQALSIAQNIRNDPWVLTDNVQPDLFINPVGAPTMANAHPYGPSYPIWVDPIGYYAAPVGNAQDWIGGATPAFGGTIRRRPTQFTGAVPANIYKNFTLWDDINFDAFTIPGSPQLAASSAVMRDTRFSWSYIFRRPQSSDRSLVETSIIVFDQRTLALNAGLSLEEYVYPGKATFNPANNTILIDYNANVAPPLRPGDWILDSTYYTQNGFGSANAHFYQVVATEEVGGNVASYEVKNPIRGYLANTNPGGYVGTAIVIRGIVDVFEKGPARLP